MQDSDNAFETTANGDTLHEPMTTTSEPPAAGFTAVNVKNSQGMSFRQDDTNQTSTTSSNPEPMYSSAPGPTQFATYGWRPDESAVNGKRIEPQRLEIPQSAKRKRSDASEVEATGEGESIDHAGDRGRSPKRGKTRDSAVDLTMADRHDHVIEINSADRISPEPAQVGPYQRERTPVARGEQPPPVRPETEAGLAASVQQFAQTLSKETPQPRLEVRPVSSRESLPSPPDDADEQHESQHGDDDQVQGEGGEGEDFDPKKRKRQFSNRTKTGCHTCRGRKKKCDEAKPTCNNCERGGFPCAGYGPKPPGYKLPGQNRQVVPLQSKTPFTPSNGPNGNWSARPDEGRTYSHWGRVQPDLEPPRQYAAVAPQPAEQRRPDTRDGWQKTPTWGPGEAPPYPYPSAPPPNFSQHPPPQTYGPDPRIPPPPHQHPQVPPPPPPPPPQQYPPQSYPHQMHLQHPPASLPMPVEPWLQYPGMPPYPQHISPPTMVSSRESVATSGSHRSAPFALSYSSSHHQEKQKMLRGEWCLHYLDGTLRQDRTKCKAAVERYNKSMKATTGTSDPERTKLMKQILDPSKRPDHPIGNHMGPIGSVDVQTLVEAPFKCDYGYNIHLGKEVIIESNCYMQDAADISIGNRAVIGNNVQFQCLTANLKASGPYPRKGSQGHFIAGAIKVEDDVYIGAGAIILPYVTIGKNAVVGAGSVVTRDVKEYTVVAGNPAKPIRRVAGDMSQHHSYEISEQEEKMKKWMTKYADSGFNLLSSPRM